MSIFQKLLQKHDIQNQTANELTQPVSVRIKKSGQVKTTFDRAYYRPGNTHQADLLYLPTDKNGDRYLLVVIDIGSGIMDARALKVRDGATVLKAFQDIYKKRINIWKNHVLFKLTQGQSSLPLILILEVKELVLESPLLVGIRSKPL